MVYLNKKEDKINDVKQLKKRKQGRALKLMGDYSLMLLDWQDAYNYYQQSQEILKKNEDYLWLGGTYEGMGATSYLKYMKCQKQYQDSVKTYMLEVLVRLKEAIQ